MNIAWSTAPMPDEAEPLLVHGIANVCIVDIDLMEMQGIWIIERLRRRNAKCPGIVYTASTASDWEEEVFFAGSHAYPDDAGASAIA